MILVRHTRVAAAPGLCYGRTDVPLAATFADEAAAIRRQLPPCLGLVCASPAQRCRQLADTLGAVEIRVDPRLQELDFGAWENRLWSDLPRAEVDPWAADYVDLAPPGGETFRALAARVDAFRRDLRSPEAVIVTHGGVIRAWLSLAAHQPLSESFAREVPYGACLPVP